MAVLTFEDLTEMHKEKFGVYPVVTGINYAGSGNLIDNIADAISSGIPYVEQELPKDIET